MLSSRQKRLLNERDGRERSALGGAARELAAKMGSDRDRRERPPQAREQGRSQIDFDVPDEELGMDDFDAKLADVAGDGEKKKKEVEIPGSPEAEIKKANEALENISTYWGEIIKNATVVSALGYGKDLSERISKLDEVMNDLMRQAQTDFITRARAKDSESIDKEIL